uniref:Reverse transcriptase zinc-binding domain-containing protein n=1 Tax=Cannabis sativa TaxID=3483 RepID=A0A803Q5P4_CANSA
MERAPLCEVSLSLWNKLWNSKILEHHKVLWWSILSNALSVRAVIRKRFLIEDASCPLCGMGEESLEHLFLSCEVELHVWRSSPWGIYPICDTGIRCGIWSNSSGT